MCGIQKTLGLRRWSMENEVPQSVQWYLFSPRCEPHLLVLSDEQILHRGFCFFCHNTLNKLV